MKLGELLEINVGKNISRISPADTNSSWIYTHEDLIHDLHAPDILAKKKSSSTDPEDLSCKYSLQAGDILYSFISSTAGVVSQINKGKEMNQNFAKLTVNSHSVDKHYLCYILNESHSVKKQMAIFMQGSVLPRMTPSILRNIDIFLPSVEKQQTVGAMYFQLNRYQYLAKKELELQRKISIQLLNEVDQ